MSETPPTPSPPQAAPLEHSTPIAAFDVDGTLIWTDSQIAMSRATRGLWGFVWGLMGLAPALLRYLAAPDRARLKAAAVRRFFGGWDAARFAAAADAFWAQHGDALIRPDAATALARHTADGDRVVLVSAAPAPIIEALGRRLGVEALATPLEVADGRITGALAGPNCRGDEKMRRLTAYVGDAAPLRAAYGDSAGDAAILAAATAPGYRVFRARPPWRERLAFWLAPEAKSEPTNARA